LENLCLPSQVVLLDAFFSGHKKISSLSWYRPHKQLIEINLLRQVNYLKILMLFYSFLGKI
jgi:hypothetical protein